MLFDFCQMYLFNLKILLRPNLAKVAAIQTPKYQKKKKCNKYHKIKDLHNYIQYNLKLVVSRKTSIRLLHCIPYGAFKISARHNCI